MKRLTLIAFASLSALLWTADLRAQDEKSRHVTNLEAAAKSPQTLKLCTVRQSLSCPASVSDTLSAVSCIDPVLSTNGNRYAVNLSVGQTLTVTMSSGSFAVFLMLESPTDSGNFAVAFGDITAFLSSGTSTEVLTYVPSVAGTYYIDAESLFSFNDSSNPSTGAYTLTVSGCTGSPSTTLSLSNRFSVRVSWTANNTSGVGTAIPISNDSGWFWFFSSNAAELMVKVVDGRVLNGRFWFFYGALSDVLYTITVTDNVTGQSRIYTNPQSHLGSVADVSAF